MSNSTLAPPRPQSIPAADRFGYRLLPWPNERVKFRISAHGPENVAAEYRGLETDLISAGLVSDQFFTQQKGRPRRDAAGRWIWLRRRRDGTRVVTFGGNPFDDQPALPGVTEELVASAVEDYERKHGTHEERCARARAAMDALNQKPAPRPGLVDRPPSLLTSQCPPELRAAKRQALVAIANLADIAENFSPQVAGEIERRVLSIEELLRKELERLAPAPVRSLPSYLRLAVDNTVRS